MEKLEFVTAEPLGLTLNWRDGRIWEWRIVWAGAKRAVGCAPGRDAGASGEAQAEAAGRDAADPSPAAKSLAQALARYAAGQEPHWPDLPLAWERLTPFAREVLVAMREHTGPGRTLTYGQLAALCGRPRAARAVGRIMARNPWPLVYPCHRVVGAGGKMVGFSAEGGIGLKRWLLGLEAGRE